MLNSARGLRQDQLELPAKTLLVKEPEKSQYNQ